MLRAVSPSGRKFLLRLAIFAAAILGGLWWWTRPPPDPIGRHWRLSEYLQFWMPGFSFSPESAGDLHAMGPAAVTWLAYTVEHGRQPFTRRGSLPFDRAPQWVRERIPDRWGGLRDSASIDERAAAVDFLEVFGPQAEPAIPALMRSLDRGNEDWVQAVLLTLNNIGPASWPAVRKALAYPDPHTRSMVIASLSQRITHRFEEAYIPPKTEVIEIAEALIKACHDPDPEVRSVAAYEILDCRNERMEAADHFDAAIPALIPLLSDLVPVRRAAMDVLAHFRAKAAPAIPALAQFLDNDQDVDLASATGALHSIGPASWPVVERTLATGRTPARCALLISMHARLEPDHDRPPPESEIARISDTFIKALHDPDRQVRSAAIQGLNVCQGNRRDSAVLDPTAPHFDSAAPHLLPFLTGDDRELQLGAFQTLGDFGSHGKQAVPHLIQLLDHEKPAIRCDAAVLLSDVDIMEQHSAERLRAMLQDSNVSCRNAAAAALHKFDGYNSWIAKRNADAAQNEPPDAPR